MFEFVQFSYTWLSYCEKNVAVVHCKGGKGRTGMTVAYAFYFSNLINLVKLILRQAARSSLVDRFQMNQEDQDQNGDQENYQQQTYADADQKNLQLESQLTWSPMYRDKHIFLQVKRENQTPFPFTNVAKFKHTASEHKHKPKTHPACSLTVVSYIFACVLPQDKASDIEQNYSMFDVTVIESTNRDDEDKRKLDEAASPLNQAIKAKLCGKSKPMEYYFHY
ncbi:hypothetical protein RFI_33170, partial [Reticulomyxa filosa]